MKMKIKMKTTNIAWIFVLINCLLRTGNGKINTQGDVVVAGLFGIYESVGEKCSDNVDINSVMTAEAVKWYIQNLNEIGGLPFRIGFECLETCSLNTKAALNAVQILNKALGNEAVIGILGPEKSSESEAIACAVGAVPQNNRLVQISFSATAPHLQNYPHFIRVIPNDVVQIEMMVQSMIKLKWNRIAVVYEDNVYGQAGYARLKSRTEKVGICIALTSALDTVSGINANDISQILQNIIIGIPQSRPPINGIVLIATAPVAKTVTSSLDLSKYSSLPIIMLSEGTNMDENVFRRYNGDVITKAKGTLLLAPPYTVITEFTQHWNAIFTNATRFSLESATNPWILDVFYKVINCAARNCNFRALTNEEITSAFRQQPLFIKYAVTAAHALVKGVASLRTEFCATKPNLCTDFLSNFQPGDMIETLKGMDISFKTDFSWGPASLWNEVLKIGQSGEVTVQDDVTSYELFNVQSGNSLADDISFVKVGSLVNNEATIEYNKIRDYDATGQELQWPDVRKAQCDSGERCSECIPLEQLQETVLHDPGDIYVVGVVPVFQISGVQDCGVISDNSGYQLAESIRFAVQKMNTKTGDYSNFFPGSKVGLIIINSCMSPAVTQRKIYELHKNGITLNNGSVIDLTDRIIGYVAEYTSTVSISVAQALSILQFVQISYASTSPALSDRNKFPYFMRVVTPDDAQARAMVEIMKKLNADYIQIVYSEGAYGEDGRDKVTDAARSSKICVVQTISIKDGDSSFQIYDKLRKYSQAKVVVVFLYPSHLKNVVSALTTQMKRGEFLFIGSEAWARAAFVLNEDRNDVMLGSLTLSLEMYQDSELRQHVQTVQPEPYRTDPWAAMFVQAKRDCYFDLSFDKTQAEKCSASNDYSIDPDFTLDTYDTQAYVAAKSLLTGADAHLKSQCGTSVKTLCKDFTSNTKGLVDEILKTRMDLDGSGSKMKVFDSNGDGNIGYRIYNIQKDEVDPSKLVYREIGRYPLEGTFTFEKDRLVYPTDTPINSRCPNEQACMGCFDESEENGSKASEMTPGDTEVDMTAIIALAVCLGVVLLACIGLAVLLYRERKKRHDSANDFYLRPRMPHVHTAETEFTKPRDDSTPSKIYFEIPGASQERRYVPMDH